MGDNTEEPGAQARADGDLDFSSYTAAQLESLQYQMDSTRFPRNHENLLAEIRRRREMGEARQFAIRFTAADGLAGWLQSFISRRHLYGQGKISLQDGEILLQGWNRTWLGAAQQTELSLVPGRVRNVFADGAWVRFDHGRSWWSRHYGLHAQSAGEASTIAAALPQSRSAWFDRQAADIRTFYRLQRAPGHHPWITLLLVLACCLLYVVPALVSGNHFFLDSLTLVTWGASVGPMVLGGEWWRLISAIFLHISLLHLAINMWVLWSVGRITESLFGNRVFILIYLVSGLFGSLLSVTWSPVASSVGASGAIFGILGTLLAYMLHGGTRLPRSVLRAHLLPTALFVIFSIVSSLPQNGVDNAAHLGGLFSGFALGFAFARKPGRDLPRWQMIQAMAALLLLLGAMAGLLLQARTLTLRSSPSEQFTLANRAYAEAETRNLMTWMDLGAQSAAGRISDAELTAQFEKVIIPFWRDAVPRLRKAVQAAPPEQQAFAQAGLRSAMLRLEMAQAVVTVTRGGDSKELTALGVKMAAAQAELEWLGLRGNGEKMTASLASAAPVVAIRNLVWFAHRPCVKDRIPTGNAVAETDSRSDGPARSEALGCEAQRLFLTRDFATLDAQMSLAASRLHDLPSGSSSYLAYYFGLSDLFSFGGMSVDRAFELLAAWRRAVDGSVHAELAEVEMLQAWAYGARGFGFADTVSGQSQQLFSQRVEMSRAALRAISVRAQENPYWYVLSIGANVLASGEATERDALFEKGRARFPDFLPLHRAMLRALMPRWFGSYEDVGRFILAEMARPPGKMDRVEKYAWLYWDYARMEGAETDIFKQAYARADTVLTGMAMAVKRLPQSDYVANVAGRLACMADDKAEYALFHADLPRRYSASVWSADFTVAQCNKKFGLVARD